MNTQQIVKKILNSKFLNDFRPSPEQIDLVDQLIANCKNDDPCELLLAQAPINYDSDKLAAVISMLIWQTPDNGAQVIETLESWAASNDIRKVRIAHSDQIEVELESLNRPR